MSAEPGNNLENKEEQFLSSRERILLFKSKMSLFANDQKLADAIKKSGHTEVNCENYLLFENTCKQADDSHYQVSHAFITNRKMAM